MARSLFNLLPCLLLVSTFANAQITSFVEDFTTLDYCDTLLTTAEWDTAAGEVRLPPFVISTAGSYGSAGTLDQLCIAGDYAYLAGHHFGLVTLDISDPTSPTLAGSFVSPGLTRDVALAGDHAYLADYDAGLVVVDISDPTSPVQVGHYDTAGYAEDVVVSGNHAYVSDGSGNALVILDITTPASPTLTSTFSTNGFCGRLFVTGDLLYVAASNALEILDVSDPATPTLIGSYAVPGFGSDVKVDGNLAYVTDTLGDFLVVDVTDPSNPALAGSLTTPGAPRGVALSGDLAFLADNHAGLQVIDISDPTSPSIVASQDTPDLAYSVVVAGEFAYVADHTAGLQVVRVANTSNPGLFSQTSTNGYAYNLAIAGNYAYIANYTSDLAVMDISDPAAPVWVGGYDQIHVAYDVAVAGDRLYVTGGRDLWAFDISDPETLVLLDEITLNHGGGYGLAVSGDHAYVANSWGDLQVFDISDPAALTHTASLTLSNETFDVAVSGDLAIVGTAFDGLRVVDISDPALPVLLGTYALDDEINGVAIEGDYAFLAAENQRFVVVDISDPAAPFAVASRTTVGYPKDVVIVGDHAHVVANSQSYLQFDISDPTNPVAGPTWDTWSYCYGIAAAGEHVYVAHASRGLVLLQVLNSRFDTGSGFVQSKYSYVPGDPPVLANLTADTNTGGLNFEMTLNGVDWQTMGDGSAWQVIDNRGNWLRWRTDLVFTPPLNPTIMGLQVDWRYPYPVVTSVTDVPADQGGEVRVNFLRSGHDFDTPSGAITSYNVLRRVVTPLLLSEVSAVASGAQNGFPVRELGDRGFVVFGDAADKAVLPDGTWEIMGSFNAMQQDSYIFPAETLADSGATVPWSVYCVTAHTADPLVWYVSQPDSGYSVDNIAPGVPQDVSAAYRASGVALDWDDAPEIDFQYFRVYRDLDPGFVPGPANLVHELVTSAWTDPAAAPWDFHYKITALDDAGNESPAAAPQTVSEVPHGGAAARTALMDAVPNPFNPSTKLAFTLAVRGHALLRVYDTAGRLVATLADGHREAGRHEVIWDGRDGAGRMSAAGVYLYRLSTRGRHETKRMVLIK